MHRSPEATKVEAGLDRKADLAVAHWRLQLASALC